MRGACNSMKGTGTQAELVVKLQAQELRYVLRRVGLLGVPRAPESSEALNRLFPQACVNLGGFQRAFRTPPLPKRRAFRTPPPKKTGLSHPHTSS